MRFRDKTAIVVGGKGALGSAIARELAAEGCDVALIGRESALDVAKSIAAATGRRAFDHPADISQKSAVTAAFEAAIADLGGLDILVNSAGVTSFGSLATLEEAEWDRVHSINLKGVFLCCQAAIEPLRRRGGGRIVNIGSLLGKNGGNARPWIDPTEQSRAGNAAYGAAKAGVHALTSFLARELASSGITVNAVAPGPIASAMTTNFPEALRALLPVGRIGQPEDVAAAVLYLASPQASFVTGEILDVNGGCWSD